MKRTNTTRFQREFWIKLLQMLLCALRIGITAPPSINNYKYLSKYIYVRKEKRKKRHKNKQINK